MKCHYCKSLCIKKGKTKTDLQKYQCLYCKKYQRENYRNKACQPGTNEKIRVYVKEGCGIRSTARLMSISATTVITKIKQEAQKVIKPIVKMRKEYEVDELKTYVKKKKNEQWVMYAINKKTKQVVDFRVGKRNKKNLKGLIETLLLSRAGKIYTDKLNIYPGLIPAEIHYPVPHQINYIERKNLNLRTHLKRLTRKTICYSKSIRMLTACLMIYFWG
ncbi:MAG: IS1 family transposase [Bacteroidetes bacterium]|nr:IS1 family transposase [Bacteroidota bacterium]